MLSRFRRSFSAVPLSVATLTFGLFGYSNDLLAAPPGAQPSGPMGPGGGRPGGPGNREKKEGPAEAAPKDKQALKPIDSTPAFPPRARRTQLFELNGNFRMRADYFHRLHLNAIPPNDFGGNKFFPPPAELGEVNESGAFSPNQASCEERLLDRGVTPGKAQRRCKRRNGISSANLRLRLAPVFHISDTVKVHTTVDLLDNMVLGSTPDSFAGDNPWAPIDLYTRTQNPPTQGQNSLRDSVAVKHAWGHIRFGWGLDFKFGRMPTHWGLGIVQNSGMGFYRGERSDIIRTIDTDYGDTIDSLRLSYDFGKDKRKAINVGVAFDWAASGPTTSQLLGPEWDSSNQIAQDFSAERYDNVRQFAFWAKRYDEPAMLQRKLSSGVPVVNYGIMAWLRYQNVDRAIGTLGYGDGQGQNPSVEGNRMDSDGLSHEGDPLGNGYPDADGDSGLSNYSQQLVARRAIVFTPDLWFRINWRTLRVEFEGSGVFGSFRHRDLSVEPGTEEFALDRVVASEKSVFKQFGYALEFKYGMFNDRFHIGMDHGFASGDSSLTAGLDHQSPWIQQDGAAGSNPGEGGNSLTKFRFNPAYMQDLILFKELLGTSANAMYFRPWAAFYFFQNNMSGRVDIEYAFAPKPTGILSGGRHYGIEIDGALRYHDADEPIFIQAQYGVLFPFNVFKYAIQGSDTKAAQSIQLQAGIQF